MKGPDMTDTPVVLEACPFCGGEAKFADGYWHDGTWRGDYVFCANELCRARNSGNRRIDHPDAIAAWNTRASRPPVAGDGGEALEHLTNVLFADPGPKLAAAHKAARLWWNAQDGLEAPPPPIPEPAEVTEEDEALACEIADAANIVSHDGYYEIDTDAVAAVLAKHRLKFSTARRDEVFRQIAEQKLWSEMTANEQADGDFVGAYDEIVTRVRAALGEQQ